MAIRQRLARADSAASTQSCITAVNDGSDPRKTDSSTPPTSVNDASSVQADDASNEQGDTSLGTRRVQRPRSKVSSYNENILSGSRRTRQPSSAATCSRAVSGMTMVEGTEDLVTQSDSFRDSIQALDLEWTVGNMPGDHLGKSTPDSDLQDMRRSTRLGLLGHAIKAAASTRSILGKRGRSVAEAGKGTLQALGKRASLRPRGQAEVAEQDGPTRKKAKLAAQSDRVGAPSTSSVREIPKQAKTKIWLEKGLYAGQARSFDARLTESQNKLKHNTAGQVCQENTIMPLPMFAGQRLLEKGRPYKLPFNIFSPLPPGQPKPEEWKRTRGSECLHVLHLFWRLTVTDVFVGEAADEWKTTKRLEHSTCICEPDSGCDDNCFNRFMFYECDESNCNIGSKLCRNRSFEDLRKRCKAGGKYNIGVEVIKTKDRGYGVRSNRSFDPGQIIVEYTGEIVTQDECERRMRSIYKNNEVRAWPRSTSTLAD